MTGSKTVLAAAVAVSGALALGALAQQHRVRAERLALLAGRAQPDKYRDAPLVIVVDVGSSSVRASCFALVHTEAQDAEWVLLDGSMQQQHADAIDEHGEADVRRIAATVERLVDGALAFLRATGLSDRVVGVGFSTFAMNVLGIDDKVRASVVERPREQRRGLTRRAHAVNDGSRERQ